MVPVHEKQDKTPDPYETENDGVLVMTANDEMPHKIAEHDACF